MPKSRKWNDKYVRYGFTPPLNDCRGPDRPQCMTCHFIMRNSNLKLARLKAHQAKHPAAEHEHTFQALQAKRAIHDQKGPLPQLGFKPMQKPPLETTTKADDASRLVADIFDKYQIKWEKLRSVCTDGALPAMIGKRSGFAALLKTVPDIIVKHCFLNYHVLAAKTLPPDLKDVLSISVQVVNFIRGRPLHHRLFKLFCEKMGSEHQVLLFHTEVRWLSRKKIWTRMAELKDEIAIFLREYQSNFADKSEDEVFIFLCPILQIYSVI